ncbi:MAG: amino acid permease, partial [bacterium]
MAASRTTARLGAAAAPGTLGTFAGVFTPSILTILGLILFRRLGYVVGAAGLGWSLAIIVLAHLISILTSISLAAIATNLRVKRGGDYYLISRSLGVEFGGALGLVLFLAQAISVAFYCIGLGEAVAALLPPGVPLGAPVISAGAICFLFVFAWLGADWATRLQYVVMAALVCGLASFFVGGALHFSSQALRANWAHGVARPLDFWVLFALYFPAVTGFTQGVSMSGDLRDPGRSLPAGTFAAVAVSLLTYMVAAIVFAGALPAAELAANYDGMDRIARLPALVTVGLVAATLSSALASFLGAPRILQALAADRVIPMLSPFARGHGATGNPRRGVVLVLVIALSFAALGGVNVLAPIVSMAFLISYGLLNYATALEARAASPSFRPRFRWFHYRASLLGAAACLAVMLMIDVWASALALAVMFALHQYVQRIAGPDRWADSRRDHFFHAVRANLLAMAGEPVHPRNWRPHLLVFTDAARRRPALVQFAAWIEGGAGLTTVVRILRGAGPRLADRCHAAELEIAAEIAERDLRAFARVVAAPRVEDGASTIIQAYGLGPIRANTILLNWLDARSGPDAASLSEPLFVRTLRAAVSLGVNVIALDAKEDVWQAIAAAPFAARRIDVWWSDNSTGRLMLLLAYMVTRSEEWRGATIRLLVWVRPGAEAKMEATLTQMLDEVRIAATIETVPDLTRDKLVERSRETALVFVPLRLRGVHAVDLFNEPIDGLLHDLPIVAMVSAAEDVVLDAAPEEGEMGRLAALGDAALAAAADVARSDKRLVRAR